MRYIPYETWEKQLVERFKKAYDAAKAKGLSDNAIAYVSDLSLPTMTEIKNGEVKSKRSALLIEKWCKEQEK